MCRRVSRIVIRNFNRFDKARFDLRDFNVAGGRNNSGRPTLLQALSLLQFCVRATLKARTAAPAAEPLDLWKDRKVQIKGKFIKPTFPF